MQEESRNSDKKVKDMDAYHDGFIKGGNCLYDMIIVSLKVHEKHNKAKPFDHMKIIDECYESYLQATGQIS